MIVGLGIDILDARRIKYLIDKFGDHFINKYFTKDEIQSCQASGDVVNSFAKVFSIKEAIIKAIANKKGMRWHSTKIFHDELGRPRAEVFCDIYGYIPNDEYYIWVSTSDEQSNAVSVAVVDYFKLR